MFTKPTPAWKNVIMTFLGAPAAKAFDCTGDATHPVCCPSGAVVGSTATDCVKAAVITLYVPQKTDGLLTTTLCGINPDSLLLTQAACCESVWPTGGFFDGTGCYATTQAIPVGSRVTYTTIRN